MGAFTRRALFGASLAVAALAVPVASAQAHGLTDDQLKLAAWLQACAGEGGLETAVQAIKAGMTYEQADAASFARDGQGRRTAIAYFSEGERCRVFDQNGERFDLKGWWS